MNLQGLTQDFVEWGEPMRDIAADGTWVWNTFHSKEGSREDTLKTALKYLKS